MKHLTIISTSSFVDLITNSSSELFVCDGRKSIDMVKEIITKLLLAHDTIEGTNYAPRAFANVFHEPELTKWMWDPYAVPRELTDEYEKYTEVKVHYPFGGYTSKNNDLYTQLENKFYDWCEQNTRAERLKYPYTTHPEEYDRIERKESAARSRIFKKYGIAKMKAYAALYKEFLKQNEYSQAEIDRVDAVVADTLKQKGKNYHWLSSFHYPSSKDVAGKWLADPMEEALYFFDTALRYDLHIQKNSVLIYTAEDNSAPYDIFAAMDSYLSARHIHLG